MSLLYSYYHFTYESLNTFIRHHFKFNLILQKQRSCFDQDLARSISHYKTSLYLQTQAAIARKKMQNHYEHFKQNLSKIEIDFKKLVQVESSKNVPGTQKKTVDAKKVAIMIQKYMDENINMLYEILTRNLGKTQISWDDLLKCLQDQFYLSYTVLKRQNKKFSISQAKWNNTVQFSKIIQYLKNKQTNYIQSIIKPNLGVNISQHSSECDILAILLEKQLIFYLIQEDRIICNFDFKYRNVRNKMLQKYQAKQQKKQMALRQNQGLDTMPMHEFVNQKKISCVDLTKNGSKNLRNSKKNMFSQSKTQSANSKVGHRSRMNSNASSQISSFMKRNSTDVGVSDWRKKSLIQKDNSVKIRSNTTKTVFQLFQNAKLQNSIEIAKKFQQARDSFEKYIVLDKKILEKQIKISIQDVHIEKKTLDFNIELERMKQASKSIQRQKKSDILSRTSNSKQGFHESSQKSNSKFQSAIQMSTQVLKGNKKSKSFLSTQNRFQKSYTEENQKMQLGQNKLLQDSTIGIVSFSFYENFLLISLYNREVRLYRIKKNLHRLKEELIFEKQNESLVIFAQIYKSIFSETYNMVLCSSRNNQTPVMKIYQIFEQTLFGSNNVQNESQKTGAESERSQTVKKDKQKDFKEIFCCKFSFDPIYQNMNPLGIGAFNQKGYFALVEMNHISMQHKNKSIVKLFQKQYTNLVTGDIISISSCKAHANMINIYFVCKNGYIYFVDKISTKIKLQKKICQSKILDIALIQNSTQILIVSERGQLMIVNSQNLEQMYFYETYQSLSEESRLLAIADNKFAFFSGRTIKVIDIDENDEKLLEYQKPLKIYRNRIKIKKQQALLTKETGEIESKKNTVKLEEKKSLQFLADEEGRGSNLQKFKSKFNKRRIQDFFTINNSEVPHYILVLQNGEVLVYDYKGEYFGSYLKKRHMKIRQALMNKKLYYLAILYVDNSIQVVNLYSQLCIVRYPETVEDEGDSGQKDGSKDIYQAFEDGEEVFCVGFLNSGLLSAISKVEKNSNSEFIFSIDKTLNLCIINSKGHPTRTIDLTQQKVDRSLFTSMTNKRPFSSVYLDKDGDLIIGTEKGQLIFYQKNMYFYIRTIKITYYPILQIQPLQKSSAISNPKDRNKYLLILAANNQLFLFNKQSRIFNKIYSPPKIFHQNSFVQKEKNMPLLTSMIKHQIQVKGAKNIKNLEIDKVSSVHYLSKIVAFSEHFVVYEWEEIYEKIKFEEIQASQINSKDELLNIRKSLQSFVKSASSFKDKQKRGIQYNFSFHAYKRVGYFIQKVKPLNLSLENKMSFRSDLAQSKHLNVDQFIKSQNIFFLPVWNTEHYSVADKSVDFRKNNLGKQSNRVESRHKRGIHGNNSLVYPFELYCFVESSRMTVVIEPQGQFLPEKNKGVLKSESLDKSKRNSRLTSTFISRKNSMESSNGSMSLEFNEKSLMWAKSKQTKRQKSTIKVYDLDEFIRKNETDQQAKQQMIKVVLEQKI